MNIYVLVVAFIYGVVAALIGGSLLEFAALLFVGNMYFLAGLFVGYDK